MSLPILQKKNKFVRSIFYIYFTPNLDMNFDTFLTKCLIKKMRQKMRQTNYSAIKIAKFL